MSMFWIIVLVMVGLSILVNVLAWIMESVYKSKMNNLVDKEK